MPFLPYHFFQSHSNKTTQVGLHRTRRYIARGDKSGAEAEMNDDDDPSAPTLVLTVFPGRLGISATYVPGQGARVARVDPECDFREYVRAGDTIVTVDDKRVTSLGDLLLGKERIRNFGIVKRSTDDAVDDEFAALFGNVESRKRDLTQEEAAAPAVAEGDGAPPAQTAGAKRKTTKSGAPRKKRGPNKKKRTPGLPVIKVQPGRLGVGVVLREGVGARVTYVDPKGQLRGRLSVGDAIVTIDGERVQSLLHFELGKDQEREFGVMITNKPETAPDAGEASAGDPSRKGKNSGTKKTASTNNTDEATGLEVDGEDPDERRRREAMLAELAEWDKKTALMISKRKRHDIYIPTIPYGLHGRKRKRAKGKKKKKAKKEGAK